MVNHPILAPFPGLSQLVLPNRPTLQAAFHNPGKLPALVSDCVPAMRLLDLIGPLSWSDFPERNLHRWSAAVQGQSAHAAPVHRDRTVSIIEHERGKYVCPLSFPQRSEQVCPIKHEKWDKQDCTVAMLTSPGARIRYTLDRFFAPKRNQS